MAERSPMLGKLCVVTGATSGIGRATAERLAEMGASVIILCRNAAKGERVAADIRKKTEGTVEILLADYSSLDSVRTAAAEFGKRHQSLQVLVNNAGLVRLRRSVTVDGFETTFQVNYLSHYLLTRLLLASLKKGAPSRIVNVSSAAHYGGDVGFDDLQMTKGYGLMKAYSRSKLLDVLFTYALAKKLAGTDVTANCLHPGAVATNMWKMGRITRLFLISPEKGAETPVYLASSPEVQGVTGKYFDHMREKDSSAESHDEGSASRLWDVSADMVRLGRDL